MTGLEEKPKMTRSPSIEDFVSARSRARLKWGVSLAAMVSALGAGGAAAQSIAALHAAMVGMPGAATAALVPPPPLPNSSASNSAAMAVASVRALRNQTQVNQALSLAQQAQAAARAAALALQSQVPDGLQAGGLQVVANPVPAVSDSVGVRTWQGANLPTANAQNPDQITVVQTDPRAILSWQTFNVGQNTTLTFQQQLGGVAQPSWVVLNRVVGQLNPLTGLRDPSQAPAPSQILGSIKADGTVLVINQNGVIFGPTAQVNVQSLVATSLEIGHALELVNGAVTSIPLSQRNDEFLNLGLLGFADQLSSGLAAPLYETFSAQATGLSTYDPLLEGEVQVAPGAAINSADGGFILMIAPRVVNGGALASPQGQVSLVSGREVTLTRSEGDANSIDPDLRGLSVSTESLLDGNVGTAPGDYVNNEPTGLITAPGGYISLQATLGGAVLDSGVLTSTTSVSRNGYVSLQGGDIGLAPDAVIAITPDDSPATIPQNPASLQAFKPSRIRIGDTGSRIDIGANSLIYAPSANISIGADPGPLTVSDAIDPMASRVFIDTGAVIDASGLENVVVPASRNSIEIKPVTQNELSDTPSYRQSFLDGATVFVDPRLSGVLPNGVAWVGSPLIEAASYNQQVGVTASELMTTGGNVTLGAQSFSPRADTSQAPDVIVKAGASIDISGGWRTFQAGVVQTTKLVDAGGQIVDIGSADPNDTYVGVYSGFTNSQPRWGVSQTYVDPLLTGAHMEGAYTEGRDAGTLTIKASVVVLDGQVFGDAFAGPQQIVDAQPGTTAGTVYGDLRKLQGAPSQLPAGGYLNVQALGADASGVATGGGDIAIVGSADYAPISPDFAYGQEIGFTADGSLIVPPRPATSVLPTNRLDVISLNADALSAMGLGQLTVQTSGKIDVSQSATVNLAAGGVFEATAGRSLTVNGNIVAPSGAIDLTTADFIENAGVGGSVLVPDAEGPGSFDITINGQLNAAGRWVNDFNVPADQLSGSAYLSGGEITLAAAPRIAPLDTIVSTDDPNAPTQSVDISGSILINGGGVLNVTGGGYVNPGGAFDLSAKGGNVSLLAETSYFQLANDLARQFPGGLPGFRVTTIQAFGQPASIVEVFPSAVTARISISPGSILAHGFGGGGTFSLTTPQFDFGDTTAAAGTDLPLDFFSNTGFSSYNIKSYKTDLIPNAFSNGLGGYNAVLATQVVSIDSGQTLSLSESMFSPLLDGAEISTLRNFTTGGDLNTVLTPIIPVSAWDQRAVNLTLGGLIELHVAQGGAVEGQSGGVLTVGELFNEGTIRIPGGTITQSEVLPSLYVSSGGSPTAIGVHSLSDVFSTGPDGTIAEAAPNAMGLRDPSSGDILTNGQVAASIAIYLLGDLDAGEGVRLATGSVTNLSGEAIINPRAVPMGGAPIAGYQDGIVVNGGVLQTLGGFASGAAFFQAPIGMSGLKNYPVAAQGAVDAFNAAPGAQINLAGAAATFDRPVVQTTGPGGDATPVFAPTPVWSDGGSLTLGSGGTITGAIIAAGGGAPAALGGVLTVLDPVLYQADPLAPTFDAISADAVEQAGFDTLIAQGSLASVGDVTLTLRRSLFVTARPDYLLNAADPASRDLYSPTISSGGALVVNAAYIGLDGAFQALSTPLSGTPAANSVTLQADAIDVTGAVLFDQSAGNVVLQARDDLRLIGVAPWQQTFGGDPGAVNPSLVGQLAVNGNLTLVAAQVYPTTGTSFTISSSAAAGSITFLRSGTQDPSTPYSAGGALTVQAASINQSGIIRVPLGALTLGGDTPLQVIDDATPNVFAPATMSLTISPGSITSVSTDGLVIPYGTTTDQIEWFFNPTNNNPLSAPPSGVLHLGGANVDVMSGSTVDLSGGGDVYAYEFIPGVGGSRDVLDQFNADAFSTNNGYQYPDQRQIYAIVPGLSNATVAPFDPIYSSDYSALYGPSQVGLQVHLSAAPGLAAGWYTLLPAKYALLPGGMRVVEDVGAATPPPSGGAQLSDGADVVTGQFGVAGTDTYGSTPLVFDVQSQAVILKESDIALTHGNQTFAADAAHAGLATPPLPIDAGRLILTPQTSLTLNGDFQTTPAAGGRGAEVDISGANLDVVSSGGTGSGGAGAIVLTADSLSALDASSLFIGGTRTDNTDGTTSLNVTTNVITVDAGATLSAPEILLATDGQAASLTIADGASIIASGTVSDPRTGGYIINGFSVDSAGVQTRVQSGQGGFVRVADGPARLLQRTGLDTTVTPGALSLGAANLQGTSVELESSGDLLVSSTAKVAATSLALGASNVTFADNATGLTGLVITPALEALVGQGEQLTVQSPNAINFQAGDYSFGDLSLDTPGLAAGNGGAVTLAGGVLQLANSSGTLGACGTSGAPACGAATMTITASQIAFGSGTLRTYGFDGAVTLTAANGILADGVATFDAGAANLALDTPFVGDRGPGLPGATLPSLTLTTTGNVAVTAPSANSFTAPSGTPGSSLIVDGQAVAIDGAQLRATAGVLQINSATGISLSNGAVLATPGYAKVFGDAADPVTVSAPGGLLTLVALNGDISVSDDSRLSINGGQGQAGTLSLLAPNGQVIASNGTTMVDFGGVVDAGAPGSGASLNLDSGGGFNLSAFAEASGEAFSGDLSIRTGQGNLQLVAGDKLKAANIQLVADGGVVDSAGTIDVSGINGGNVNLYGSQGVHLRSGSLIDAHADGYGATDSRQASGGNVTLGVDGSGAISVDQGAVIDVGARNTGNRLIPLDGGDVNFAYVGGDQGGSVTFRAPVIEQGGVATVAVTVQGAVDGAGSVVLEGYRQFDLGALAADPDFVGVSVVDGQALLDLGATASGKLNPLTDYGAGTVVQFVQDFNISAAYGGLNGLASQANFHARPGVELDYSGDIVLQSNWNLGAGQVNVAGAVAAGLMAPVPDVPGQFYVLPGMEGAVFSGYTTMTYRVGGAVDGEPGVLALRASGNLDLQGSITDGFFQFRDQTDPNYLSYVFGGGNRTYQGSLTPACAAGDCGGIDAWAPNATPSNYVAIDFPAAGGLTSNVYSSPAPYSAAANAPNAAGSMVDGGGDPLGSAELFPLLPTADGGTKPVNSWSYQLVAGANLNGAAGQASVDPMATLAGTARSVTVEGQHVYSYQGVAGKVSFADSLLLGVNNADGSVTTLTADQWYQAFLIQNPGLQADSYTTISLSTAPKAAQPVLAALAAQFFAAYPGQAQISGSGVTTKLSLAADFMAYVSANFTKVAATYIPPKEQVNTKTVYATAPTLVRTGAGDIQIAASGDIDLRNGATPTILDQKTGELLPAVVGGPQLGGAAVYTAGHLAQLGTETATDIATGQVMTVDLASNEVGGDVFTDGGSSGYAYGGKGIGYAGILIANPVYADGGGNLSLAAGGDILGRRDTQLETELGGVGTAGANVVQSYSWIGGGAQSWRTGVIGAVVNALIDPQLFQEGVGALAGGNIGVTAGGSVSDISLVSTASLTTAGVSGGGGSGPAAGALVTLGGGDINVVAGRDLLGGRVDVASGQAELTAFGSVASAGQVAESNGPGAFVMVDNTLRLRLTDATVDIRAGGGVTLQGVAALGVGTSDSSQVQANLDAEGFYAPEAAVSIVANGAVSIANAGIDVVTAANSATDETQSAVYPGSLEAVSMTGGLDIVTTPSTTAGAPPVAGGALLYPSPTGTLTLIAAGNISPLTIAMEDADPTVLPGAFSNFSATAESGVTSGVTFLFPAVLPDTSDVTLRTLHNASPTHTGDTVPNRIIAGGDILNLIFSSPKQARISAGQDIVNAVFFGQNLSPADVTRIVAGRDITATTTLVRAEIAPNVFGDDLPAVQGNTFVIGGPGAFFLEAGRDAGPFLNSAVTDGLQNNPNSNQPFATGVLSYAGGIQSVGNLWNPWLPQQGADIFTEFGVAKGQNFTGLVEDYLSPGNFANLPDALFEQTTGANGVMVANRGEEIYAVDLITWMRSIAPSIVAKYQASQALGPTPPSPLVQFAQSLESGQPATLAQALSFLPQVADQRMPLIPWLQLNYGSVLTAQFGTLDVTYQQAFDAFQALPTLNQRQFLLKDVYFNELIQTSIPSSPSYLQYSRGYEAVNILFPSSLGYTQNDLTGGVNGANTPVETGNLDLRLATIQTDQGGDVVILGPGGNVLAGSTVSTSRQAATRAYDGGALFSGDTPGAPLPAVITQIPVGFEGILTLGGGGIDAFTDGNFLLNQSRLFTEEGGDVAMWSSNGNLNAGQGPKTSADFPPIVVRLDEDGFSEVNAAAGVSGAGIAAFQPDPTAPSPDVFLIAPRGTVDAGAGGVRSAGNIYVAALQVANADNFQVGGAISGLQGPAAVNVAAQTSASAASGAAAQAAQAAAGSQGDFVDRSLIIVDVLGYLADFADTNQDDDDKRRKRN
jgi:filamentous hemagglutinin family protein